MGAAKVAANAGADPKKWKIERAAEGSFSFGPVAIRATSAPDTKPTGLFDPAMGGQAAVIRAGGVLTTKVHFPKAGHFALELHAAGKAKTYPGIRLFTISVGGKNANPRAQGDERSDRSLALAALNAGPTKLARPGARPFSPSMRPAMRNCGLPPPRMLNRTVGPPSMISASPPSTL